MTTQHYFPKDVTIITAARTSNPANIISMNIYME
jgi:hypothetical protein